MDLVKKGADSGPEALGTQVAVRLQKTLKPLTDPGSGFVTTTLRSTT
jgi:hypothetical protein